MRSLSILSLLATGLLWASPASAGSLTTTFSSNNSQNGNIFDITISKDMCLTGFSINPTWTGADTIEFYTRTGGLSLSSGGWTKQGSYAVSPTTTYAEYVVTSALNIAMTAGSTYGLYITTTNTGHYLGYTNATTVGRVYTSDAYLSIKEGYGMAYPWSSSFSPRIWNGTLTYSTGGANWYKDADGDGYGDPTKLTNSCTQPTGYVSNNTDCDDTTANRNPGKAEICDSIDNDCDGTVDDGLAQHTWYQDLDRDGYGTTAGTKKDCNASAPSGYAATSTDCDDYDASVYPSATEYCDGVDQDCDGTIDDNAIDAITWYKDADSDGYGSPTISKSDCNSVTGYVSNNTDCDDANASIHPNASEYCNGYDDDCDGTTDESSAVNATTWYKDADGDGYGTPSTSTPGCTQPSGYVADNGDCNDGNLNVHPGASEYCNSSDDDCDGTVDDNPVDGYPWYADADGDGYGDSSRKVLACSVPVGYVGNATDCSDTASTIHPGALEYCNSLDDDCDGVIDPSTSTNASTWYRDADADGYGTASSTTPGCTQPSGYVSDKTDCNDGSSSIHPGASEYCNATDDDCDGAVDETPVDGTNWYADADGDGYGNASRSNNACSAPSGYVGDNTDCVDTNAKIHPNASESCNGIDDDCDGTIDPGTSVDALSWYQDSDGDKYGNLNSAMNACSQPSGYVALSTDCDDTNAAVSPAAQEVCNNIDDNCDGQVDVGSIGAALWYQDLDADTYGDVSHTQSSCSQPTGYVSNANDCNDGSPNIHPNADEHCDAVDEDCDGVVDDSPVDGLSWYADADADGYGNASRTVSACSAPSGYVGDSTDCVDTNSVIHPNAIEVCNGLDDDCDGVVDPANASGAGTWYLDADGDSYGDRSITDASCQQPTGYVASPDDCNDADPSISPSATEVCDTIDNDCDGQTDEADASGTLTWYADADGDTYGDLLATTPGCTQPTGYVGDSTDCNDQDPNAYPGATEIPYDNLDQDCNGTDVIDQDGDGYAADIVGGLDCVDTDPSVYPGALETGDGVDENCDGTVDEGTAYYDNDGDGYTTVGGDCDDANSSANPAATEAANGVDDDCDGIIDNGTALYDDDGDGQSENQGDCNDGDPLVSSLNSEVLGNGVDDNCDGIVDAGEVDGDGDGYTSAGGDCAVEDPNTYPGAPELADGIDNNCDGVVDENTNAYDDDGDGYTEDQGDSNDSDAGINPGAEEKEDGVDNNGNGQIDEGTDAYDDDGDGYTENGGDCDDSNAESYPGGQEVADNADNDCDGAVDEGAVDLDGDGYAVDAGDCDDTTGWANPAVNEVCDGIDNNCNGDVDEECSGAGLPDGNDTGGAKAPTPCGCAEAPLSGSLGFVALGLALVAGRRKR